MNSMEQKKNIDVLAEINELVSLKYEKKTFGKFICNVNKSGVPFFISAFPDCPALVVEYAETEQDAALGRFEDGDRFYYDDYSTIQLLAEAILNEIEEI